MVWKQIYRISREGSQSLGGKAHAHRMNLLIPLLVSFKIQMKEKKQTHSYVHHIHKRKTKPRGKGRKRGEDQNATFAIRQTAQSKSCISHPLAARSLCINHHKAAIYVLNCDWKWGNTGDENTQNRRKFKKCTALITYSRERKNSVSKHEDKNRKCTKKNQIQRHLCY